MGLGLEPTLLIEGLVFIGTKTGALVKTLALV